MLHYDRQPGFNHLTHFIERAPSHDVRLFTLAFSSFIGCSSFVS